MTLPAFLQNWLPEVITLIFGGGFSAAFFRYLQERGKFDAAQAKLKADEPFNATRSAAEFQKILNTHAETLIKDLKKDVDGFRQDNEVLRKRVVNLENEIKILKEENIRCEQEANQLKQHVESLEGFLRRQGLDIPKGRRVERALTVIEKGKTTVTQLTDVKPAPKKPRTRKPPQDEA